MKELSLNILDIAENSFKAEASFVHILLEESKAALVIGITDNGRGMSAQMLNSVTDPFFTTRTTRRVGMGIPLFKLAAEQTGGELRIASKSIEEYPDSHGTEISARFCKDSIDIPPLGDIISTAVTLIQGHPDTDILFEHKTCSGTVSLDTRQLRAVLGEVPLGTPEVLCWIKESLLEQYTELSESEASIT